MTEPMRKLSDLLPLSHVIGALRDGWLRATDDAQALWYCLLVTAVALTPPSPWAHNRGMTMTVATAHTDPDSDRVHEDAHRSVRRTVRSASRSPSRLTRRRRTGSTGRERPS